MNNRKTDAWLLAVVAILCVGGPIMVYSSSAVVAADDTGDGSYFVVRQLMAMAVGVVLCVVTALTPLQKLRDLRWWIYGATILGLLLCNVPGLAHSAKGATRWIGVGGFHLQPSEFAKIAVLLVLGDFLDRYRGVLHDPKVMLRALLIPAPALVLILAEPDFGTTVIVAGGCAIMMFLAGIELRYVGIASVVGLVVGTPVMLFESYRVQRLTSFLDPWAVSDGDGYQVIQSWVALHSGGLMGQGLGNSVAKLYFLPEPWNDFIAAVIGEELGFIGLVVVMALYLVILWRGCVIARQAKDLLGTMVAGSVTALLVMQAFFNLGVVLGMVPPKGLVLPFVSYGASALMAHLWGVGLLLTVASEAELAPSRASMPLGVRWARSTAS